MFLMSNIRTRLNLFVLSVLIIDISLYVIYKLMPKYLIHIHSSSAINVFLFKKFKYVQHCYISLRQVLHSLKLFYFVKLIYKWKHDFKCKWEMVLMRRWALACCRLVPRYIYLLLIRKHIWKRKYIYNNISAGSI